MNGYSDQSSRFNELQQLDSAMDMLRNAELRIGDIFESLVDVIRQTKDDIHQLEEERKHLQVEKRKLEKRAAVQAKQISGLTRDQMNLLKEYEEVKQELEKFTKIATSVGKINLEDMRATLSLYSVLFEQVFDNQPHFKILYMLHGESSTISMDQIKNAMGMGGAVILRACHELANADLINFDTDTRELRLKRRFYEKSKPK